MSTSAVAKRLDTAVALAAIIGSTVEAAPVWAGPGANVGAGTFLRERSRARLLGRSSTARPRVIPLMTLMTLVTLVTLMTLMTRSNI